MSRVISEVLEKRPSDKKRIKEIILAAPDIDATVFKQQIAPKLIQLKTNITLYSSTKDLPLLISKELNNYPRAGQSGKELVVIPGIETIDASSINTDLLGHSYFSNTRTVLSDIYNLISQGQRASTRYGLQKVSSQGYHFWKFRR